MIEGQPSRTAWRVATRRAAHQLFDDPKVLDDPIALRIIGEREAARLRGEGPPPRGRWSRSVLRAFLVVRSRVAEDALASAVATGVRQYVVLGAGLDTFAYRNPYPDVRVFEIDHPATQAWKRERLQRTGIVIPPSTTFVSVDFTRERLRDALQTAGVGRDGPVFFSWLGVTPYLERDAILATLGDVHACAGIGGGITFDYALAKRYLNWRERVLIWLMARRVRRAGEPWRTFLDPAVLAADLTAIGFNAIDDLDARTINARYFDDRADGLRVARAGHIVTAWRRE